MKKILSWALGAVLVSSFVVWAAQVAVLQTDTREEAWTKETLNNSDLQTNIDGKADALGADDNYVDDAEKVVIGNTSGTNSGDNAANSTYTIGSATQAWDFLLDDISDLTDPGADRITFWDETAGIIDWLIIGTGLTITDKTISASGATATLFNDIGSANGAATLALGAYQHQWTLGTAGAWRIGDATDYFEIVESAGDYIFRIVDGASDGNIWMEFDLLFANENVAPTVTGNLKWDNTVTGITRGALSWYDGVGIRYLVDLATLPVTDGYQIAYNATNDNFEMVAPASGGTVASSAEVNAGTDNAKFISPDALAGSNAFTKDTGWVVYDSDVDTAVADGKQYFLVPQSWSGMNLTYFIAGNVTAGVTGTTDIQIRRVRGVTAVNMLSTGATIDTTELDTTTAATPYVIDTSNDDLATGDKIFIDVDGITTTAAIGLSATIEARLP